MTAPEPALVVAIDDGYAAYDQEARLLAEVGARFELRPCRRDPAATLAAVRDASVVLVRESPVLSPAGNFSSVMNDVAHQVEHILGDEFKSRGLDPKFAELYSQALVGMVALVGQWWREARKPKKEMVAAHLVNLAWNGLSHLEVKPTLLTRKIR